MRRAWTLWEAVGLAGVTGVALLLRLWHVDGPSLWWDEIVQIGTAQQDSLAEVLRRVKLGSPPGSGNAGAVPLDYLLLHLWQRLVPFPHPEHLEAYFRLPACLASAATPPALHLWARRHFDPATALAGALFVALSPLHIAYAVEARFYSLFGLATVVNLATFSWVATSHSGRAWVTYALFAVAYFLTGLFGLLVLGAEYAVLAASLLVARRARDRAPDRWRPREAIFLAGSAGLTALATIAYYAGTHLGTKARVRRPPVEPLEVTVQAMWQYTSESVLLVAALLVGAIVIARASAGHRLSPALGGTLLALLATMIPAVALLERWKEYYFHPRHALFVLPVVGVVVAVGLVSTAGWLLGRSRRGVAAAAAVVLLCVQGPSALAYVHDPTTILWQTKTIRDVSALTRDLRDRTQTFRPAERLLVVAQRFGDGYLANPILAKYLQWWDLTDVITLATTEKVAVLLQQLKTVCGSSCRGQFLPRLMRNVSDVRRPLAVPPDALALLALPRTIGPRSGFVGGVVALSYSHHPRPPLTDAFRRGGHHAILTWQLTGETPR